MGGKAMHDWVKSIVEAVEPISDPIYGPRYRCSLTLKDGMLLPCAVIQSRRRLVEQAMRRFQEERQGTGRLGGADSYAQIVSTFVSGGNRINDYDVSSSAASRFAIPVSLLSRIEGETSMGWTGWVFRMRDGRHFSYGSTFHMDFFELPDGYEFSDVEEVINHSFVDASGAVAGLRGGARVSGSQGSIFRERMFFTCAVDGI